MKRFRWPTMDRGSVTTEMAVFVTPALILLAMFIVFCGRAAAAKIDVNAMAAAAARSAADAPTAAAARTAASQAAAARADPDVSLRVLDDRANEVVGQSLLAGVGGEVAVSQADQAAAERADPERPLSVLPQIEDGAVR